MSEETRYFPMMEREFRFKVKKESWISFSDFCWKEWFEVVNFELW